MAPLRLTLGINDEMGVRISRAKSSIAISSSTAVKFLYSHSKHTCPQHNLITPIAVQMQLYLKAPRASWTTGYWGSVRRSINTGTTPLDSNNLRVGALAITKLDTPAVAHALSPPSAEESYH